MSQETEVYSSYFFLVIAMLSIQFGASIAKGLFVDLGPAGTTALRVFFSALILLAIANPLKNKSIFKKIISDKSQLALIAGYGLSLGLMNLFFYFSLQRIPLGLAVTIEFAGPLAVSILYSHKWRDVIWVILAASGLGILFYHSGENKIDYMGMFLALVAAFFWALYIIFGKKAIRGGHASLIVSSLGMCFAAAVALPAGLLLNTQQVINPNYWLAGLGVAILSSAIPYSLELKAMNKIPEKTFGILMSFEPIVATMIGLIFLHESLDIVQITAMSFVIAACVGSSYES
ncbi:EamA family transporter [Bdellovibrio sp. qaytius]|nr:EamA family transporter [Bdellovibrio sp. qaytius]